MSEKIIFKMFKVWLDSDELTKQKKILIETNEKITDNCGIAREFDLYWSIPPQNNRSQKLNTLLETTIDIKSWSKIIQVTNTITRRNTT